MANNYITKKRARFRGVCGAVNIPYGTPLEEKGGWLWYKGERLCAVTSQHAHDYFARNADGHGQERGSLTTAIIAALSKKDANHQARWDKVWEDPVCQKYKRPEYDDYFLWSHEFYEAPIGDLRSIAALVGAKY